MILLPFKPGDVVRLRSEGPRMTVEAAEGDFVDCVWFSMQHVETDDDGDSLGTWSGPHRGKFKLGVLRLDIEWMEYLENPDE